VNAAADLIYRRTDWVYYALAALEAVVAGWLAYYGAWTGALSSLLFALALLSFVRARRYAYRHGWLRGRSEMLASLDEGMRRGMGYQDWVLAELERDGIRITFTPPDGSHEQLP